MLTVLRSLYRLFRDAVRDLTPIVLVIAFFQVAVVGQPIPDAESILVGFVFVILGLMLFVRGLESGLFPLGEALADGLAHKGSLTTLLIFAFCLGFATTVAEPALIAVAGEAATAAAAAGAIGEAVETKSAYALSLRMVVAVSVGLALVIGVFRILRGWPIQYLIVGGYLGIMVLSSFAPSGIIGVAYDAGGVTTSTITVPLAAALGVGLAASIRGRSPMIDGFGLIALASLTPIIFVLVFGMVV